MFGRPSRGTLYRLPDYMRPTIVTPLSNEPSLNYVLSNFQGQGYQHFFTESVKAAQAALVEGLRESHAAVEEDDAEHLLKVCGVRCRDEQSCVHTLSEADLFEANSQDSAHIVALTDDEQQRRMIVACDPFQTKLRDDAMECFPRGDRELVVRVHLFYPNSVACGSAFDLRARLVTQKQFVPKDARNAQGHHLLNRERRSDEVNGVPLYESMFPVTPEATREVGFNTATPCTAVTVECVFVRDAARRQPPYYSEDTEQTRVYFSHLRATALVTDDELAAHLPLASMNPLAMPGRSDSGADERFNVLVRLFLLAHDQGWTATLSAGSPHPLGGPQLPVLFRTPSTEVDVADRRDPGSLALLQQALQPDVESQITRFCFRRVVSEALRRRVVAAGSGADAAHDVPVVCYMPHGDRVPAFTDAQIAALATLYPALAIAKPATRADWARLSSALYQHGVALLDILQAVGAPLVDAQGVAITTDAYVPYTPDMADAYFLVIANRPLRDYTCVVNQRWLLEDVLQRRCDSATTRDGFHAWVRYWNTMMQLKHELEDHLSVDTVTAHLGQRLPNGETAQAAACLVTGRVTDTAGGLIFPDLDGRRFADAKHVGQLPPGTAVVYRFWWDKKLRFEYLRNPFRWSESLAVLRQAKNQHALPHGRRGRGRGSERGLGRGHDNGRVATAPPGQRQRPTMPQRTPATGERQAPPASYAEALHR